MPARDEPPLRTRPLVQELTAYPAQGHAHLYDGYEAMPVAPQ